MRQRRQTLGLLLLVVLLGALWLVPRLQGGDQSPPAAGDPPASATRDAESGLPVVEAGTLPPEAAETLSLIDDGGPFPYGQDGAVFQNREGLLPQQPRGFYHEYTVVTPGSEGRGARRIVTGEDGAFYWTDDHYDSFARIRR